MCCSQSYCKTSTPCGRTLITDISPPSRPPSSLRASTQIPCHCYNITCPEILSVTNFMMFCCGSCLSKPSQFPNSNLHHSVHTYSPCSQSEWPLCEKSEGVGLRGLSVWTVWLNRKVAAFCMARKDRGPCNRRCMYQTISILPSLCRGHASHPSARHSSLHEWSVTLFGSRYS